MCDKMFSKEAKSLTSILEHYMIYLEVTSSAIYDF